MGETDIFVEWIAPSLPLVIFGAGDDAIPMVAIANHLGWDITVADPRPVFARAERFPGAHRVVVLPPGEDPAHSLVDRESAVVMMTHNYSLDARLLPRIVAARPRYLGLLGPKARSGRLFRDIGLRPPPFVHAPAGLDLGSPTPEAIALSITAEVAAVVAGHGGGKLRRRKKAIHDSAYEVGLAAPDQTDAQRPACGVAIAPAYAAGMGGHA